MTKDEIAKKIAAELALTKKESKDLVDAAFSILKDTLENGEPVKIPGFGSFIVKQKRDRRGRNPQTGEDMTITARKVLFFKSSNLLRTALNC